MNLGVDFDDGASVTGGSGNLLAHRYVAPCDRTISTLEETPDGVSRQRSRLHPARTR